jgi:hypothetical protein
LFAERARLRGRPATRCTGCSFLPGATRQASCRRSLCAYTADHLVTRREIRDVVAFRN